MLAVARVAVVAAVVVFASGSRPAATVTAAAAAVIGHQSAAASIRLGDVRLPLVPPEAPVVLRPESRCRWTTPPGASPAT